MKKDLAYAKGLSLGWIGGVKIQPYTVIDSVPISWTVDVQFLYNPDGHFTLETARGGDRIFKTLDSAVTTIRQFWNGSIVIEHE